jgi:hypothetical protein
MRAIPAETSRALHRDHIALNSTLDELRAVADAIDDATPDDAASLIGKANCLVRRDNG